jgi:ADP-ribosylglycohydrolase
MGYFDELNDGFQNLLRWLELRYEHRVDVEPKVRKLAKQIRKLTRQMEKARPCDEIAANEPNDLADILAQREEGPRKLWQAFSPKEYAQRLEGAFLARAAGCTLGAIVEGWPVERMKELAEFSGMDFPPTDYWTIAANPQQKRYGRSPCADYTRAGLKHMPVDDDLTYTVLGLLILEDFGPGFTTEQVGQAWVKYLPVACTAEKVALQNLKEGVPWRKAGKRGNPFMEWIGADIRSDPWGYAAPGWPEKAAELAYRDAYLSHRYNGIYGEMYFSSVIAAAFAVGEPLEACLIGLSEIPKDCRLHADVTWALQQAEQVKDHLGARELVNERFRGMHPVHTNNNACLTIFGLALGGRDVTKVIGNTVAMGMDNDCTGATAGSIVGACVGIDGVPEHWYKPFQNKVRTYINGHEWFTVPDVVKRFTKAAKAVWSGAR